MSTTDGYRWYVGDLRTGKISRQVDLIDTTWSTAFDNSGSLTGSFPLRSREWPNARADSAPAKQFLAAAYVNADNVETFIEAGPIWTANCNDASGILQIGAASLSSYFDHRKVIPVLTAGQDPSAASVTYDAAELGLIAKRLVELSQSYTAGHLPIVLPTDADLGGAGTAVTRTYPGYELGTVGDRLQQLSEVENGPEVQFVPRRRTDDPRYLEWVMRVGVQSNSMMLTQTGPAWIFDRRVPKSPVADIDVASDGSSMATRAWASGQGEAEGTPIVYADNPALTDLGWPMLEAQQTAIDTVAETDTLNAYTAALLAKSSRPIETWTVKVDRKGKPDVGQYRPGDWATVRIASHIFLPDGDSDMRILSMAGDAGKYVTLSMWPRLGDV